MLHEARREDDPAYQTVPDMTGARWRFGVLWYPSRWNPDWLYWGGTLILATGEPVDTHCLAQRDAPPPFVPVLADAAERVRYDYVRTPGPRRGRKGK